MQYTVENVSSVKKTLHIEVPADEVVRELNSAYKELKKRAKVKGFRPGKIPRSVLERLFKKDVHADVSSKLIQSSFMEALKETELKVIGNPQLDPPELDASGPYAYDATVEISPEIDDIDYKGLALKRTNYTVSDEEVEAQLKILQKNMADYQKIEESRPIREDDYALIDYEGFREGQPFPETALTQNFRMKIGDGQILKELDDQIIGMKPGDTKEVNVTFPQGYSNENLAGLDISFRVTLNEIREEVLPKINDALAKKAGQYETLDELKKVIVDNLNQGYSKRMEQELHEQIYQDLIAKTDFEVPDTLVEMELEGIVAEAERSFAYRNISMEDLGVTRESIAEKYRDTAVKQVKRHLLLNKMIDQEDLSLSDDELESALGEMAENFNQPLEEIKKYYDQQQDKLEFFKHTLLEKKAIKLIIDSGKIEDVEPEEKAPDQENEQVATDG
ncbi:MAG: trigger factor [Desulfobacterales bacterium]|jgi:trigger factor